MSSYIKTKCLHLTVLVVHVALILDLWQMLSLGKRIGIEYSTYFYLELECCTPSAKLMPWLLGILREQCRANARPLSQFEQYSTWVLVDQ